MMMARQPISCLSGFVPEVEMVIVSDFAAFQPRPLDDTFAVAKFSDERREG